MCDSYHFIEHGPMIPGMRHQVLHGFVGFLNIAISGGTLLVQTGGTLLVISDKGSREIKFGHKVNIGTGKSNLILVCEILKGNPADSTLYQGTIDKLIDSYNIAPRDSATDGGYASKVNAEFAQRKGIINIVFNKIVGSLKNIVSSKNIETRLKKWRSGIEANISNLIRGYNLTRCNWKGLEHFKSKVLWSVIAYNVRVMTAAVLNQV